MRQEHVAKDMFKTLAREHGIVRGTVEYYKLILGMRPPPQTHDEGGE